MRHQLGRWEKEPVDTPSLRDVGRTAPYFHDGRYLTLEALLADKDSRMGATASLSDPERAALHAYLESL
jgi:cytochrome c peroxidase